MGLLKTVFEVNLGLFGATRGGLVHRFHLHHVSMLL